MRLKSIKAKVAGNYTRPEKPFFVLDMLRTYPPKDGKLGWSNIEKLTHVFGFPELKHLHFSEITEEKLKAIDPSLIVLSPSSSELKGASPTKVRNALTIVEKSGIPIVGICLGHQWFARLKGSRVISGKEWGSFRINIVKNDIIFKGIPRYPFFLASQSHNYMVDRCPSKAELLASSKDIKCQVFKYKHIKCYSFQGHIERGWEDSTPTGCKTLEEHPKGV